MLPDRVSNPGPLTYESGALTIALGGPAVPVVRVTTVYHILSNKMPWGHCISHIFYMAFPRQNLGNR